MRIPLMNKIFDRSSTYEDHTVNHVDLKHYAGRWYEIAAFPSWFEKGCRCSIAEYSFAGDHMELKNTCKKDGRVSVFKARAYPIPGTNNSQLKVRYMWPLKRDYWIIALDEDYEYAMVGDPRKKHLWILSRAPEMDEATYRSLVQIAAEKGYDVSRLRQMDQSCTLL